MSTYRYRQAGDRRRKDGGDSTRRTHRAITRTSGSARRPRHDRDHRPTRERRTRAPATCGWRSARSSARSATRARAWWCSRAPVATSAPAPISAVAAVATTAAPPTGNQLDGMRVLGEVVLAVHACPVPVIAKVDGVCVGAGFGLALATDVTWCSDRARFSAIFAKRGLSLDFGTSWLLRQRIGAAQGEGDRVHGGDDERRTRPRGRDRERGRARGRARRRGGHARGQPSPPGHRSRCR